MEKAGKALLLDDPFGYIDGQIRNEIFAKLRRFARSRDRIVIFASSDFRSLSLTGPRLVRSSVPSDPKGKSDALELALKGFDVGTRPSLWKPWDDAARQESLPSPVMTHPLFATPLAQAWMVSVTSKMA